MREVFIERKTAIEAIHFAGHTPLYIETESEKKDQEARDTMDTLIQSADAFVSIFYLSEGRRAHILGGATPIEYELAQFIERHPGKPVLMFRKIQDDAPVSPVMVNWFEANAKKLTTVIDKFETPHELYELLRRRLRSKHFAAKTDNITPPHEFTVLYMGPDYIGLVGKLAEVIFTKHKLNIDYISHAAHRGHSTVCLSCSPRMVPGGHDSVENATLKEDLLLEIREDIRLAPSESRWPPTSDSSYLPEIVVNRDNTTRRNRQFFVSLRTIDAPGQLNAVCEQLRKRLFNIDEMHLHPSPPEYPRQTDITLWLSSHTRHDAQHEIDNIEGVLQYLVGVRALSVRIARPSSLSAAPRQGRTADDSSPTA